MEPAFLVVSEEGSQRTIPLDSGVSWKLGRQEGCELKFASKMISRNHAMLQRDEANQFMLIDMGSRNGSFVNGQRVAVPVTLQDGDEISIGDIQLEFHGPKGAPAPKPLEDKVSDMSGTLALFSVKEITVLVVDVRGFTKMSQEIGENLLCQVMGTFFRKGGAILQEQNSWSQKYIGDAIMSVWVHANTENRVQDIRKILHALVELSDMATALQQEFELPTPVRIGAGINSGLAALGNAGGSENADYTALGDTVNAAFRIETATKEVGMDLLVGDQTFDSASQLASQILITKHGGAAADFKPQDWFSSHVVSLKGYDKPAKVWGIHFSELRSFVDALPPL
jgi:adenylate cyclase